MGRHLPVGFDQLSAHMEVRTLEQQHHSGPGTDADISVRHPGRVRPPLAPSRPDRSVIFIPDNELDPFGDHADAASSREALVDFARGASILIHDAMYTGTEYMDHRGWGHSSYRDAVDFAIAAEVETLVLFHHEPDRSDEALDEMLALCHKMVGERNGSVNVIAATEGMELTL
jgi:hypothetical protein